VILAGSPEPQPSNVPTLGGYEMDHRRQLQEERRMDYRQHLAAVCDAMSPLHLCKCEQSLNTKTADNSKLRPR